MNMEELDTAITALRELSVVTAGAVVALKTRGVVVNSGKYCKLRVYGWLISTFQYHIEQELETPTNLDELYNRLIKTPVIA